jgi:hypothetical protein
MTLASLSRCVSEPPWSSPRKIPTLLPVAAMLAAMVLLGACGTTPETTDGSATTGGTATTGTPVTTGTGTPAAGACVAPAAWFPHANPKFSLKLMPFSGKELLLRRLARF